MSEIATEIILLAPQGTIRNVYSFPAKIVKLKLLVCYKIGGRFRKQIEFHLWNQIIHFHLKSVCSALNEYKFKTLQVMNNHQQHMTPTL